MLKMNHKYTMSIGTTGSKKYNFMIHIYIHTKGKN